MFFHTGMVKMRCWNTVRDCVRHHVVKIRLLSSFLNKLPHLWCTTVSPSQNWWSPIVTRRGRSDSWSRSSPAGRSLLTTSQARKHAGIRWVWPSRQEKICFDGILFCAWGSPGMSMPDFDNQTLAALRGRMVRYLMRSREVNLFFFPHWMVELLVIANTFPPWVVRALQITLGRATKDKPIDVDLSLEGPAWKISRKQGEFMVFGWRMIKTSSLVLDCCASWCIKWKASFRSSK